MQKTGKSGFTLVELSVVLIIVSLLAGGILVGRDMFNSAQIRAAARQIEVFNTAYTTFLLKYGCVPGDCGNAESFGFTPMVVTLSKAEPVPSFNVIDQLNPISTAQAFSLSEQEVTSGDIIAGEGSEPVGAGSSTGLGSYSNVYNEMVVDNPTLQNKIVEYNAPWNPAIAGNYVGPASQLVLAPVSGNSSFSVENSETLGSQISLAQAHLFTNLNVIKGSFPIKIEGQMSPINHNFASWLLINLTQAPNGLFENAGAYYVGSATLIPGSAGGAAFSPVTAFRLDSLMDDGEAATGGFRTTSNPIFLDGGNIVTLDPNSDVGPGRCITTNADGKYVYNIALGNPTEDVTKMCLPVVKAAHT